MQELVPIEIFPATEPFQMLVIDTLEEFLRPTRGNRYVLAITDQFSKLVQRSRGKKLRPPRLPGIC